MKRKILILGLGISGKSAAAFLLQQNCDVIAIDQKADTLRHHADVVPLLAQGLILCTDHPLQNIDQLILSPGIPLTHPVVQQAKQAGVEVIGEIEFAFRYIRNRCVGVTGSNGKTTTVLLIAHILNHAGIAARALGNVGLSLSSYLLNPDPKSALIVELSSFQLETLQARCLDFAVILNITENHLDRYDSMEAYAQAKLIIQRCLKPQGKLFVSSQVSMRYNVSAHEIAETEEEQSFQFAFAICKEFGLEENQMQEALKTFQRPPHRIEWVAEIDGVRYYNDSKSSSVESVMHALKRLAGPTILIVGGTDKGASYRPWAAAFRGKVKQVIAYGKAAEKIEQDLAGAVPLVRVGPFAEAVDLACKAANQEDTVLLSPGCSSYDQFTNFEHRGNVFRELIMKRKDGS